MLTPFRGPRRSLIFVPGNKPEWFPKALKYGADVVCVDLEDAIAPNQKSAARKATLELFEKYQKKSPDRSKASVVYAAMIESVDQGVGQIMVKLKELGITQNTVIIFTSDNGGHGGVTSMSPLRGAKGTLYEGGIRVPLIVHWPGRLNGGVVIDTRLLGRTFIQQFLK